jgi:hypothetical protein
MMLMSGLGIAPIEILETGANRRNSELPIYGVESDSKSYLRARRTSVHAKPSSGAG